MRMVFGTERVPRIHFLAATAAVVLGSLGLTARAAGPEPAGWYSGDIHVHRSCGTSPESVQSLYNTMVNSNLNVISLLADMGNGEVQNATTDLPLVNGQDASISTSGRLVHWDTEWHWDATYTQYPHQALGGHIVCLGLNSAAQVWNEMTSAIFDWAHQRNGIAGFAHFQYLDEDIPSSLSCCTPIDYPSEVALGSCDFVSEDVNGSDVFLHSYYRLLNCGFRPGFAAGSDHPCAADVGTLLTYSQCAGGQLTYRNWIQGIKTGRTVVSRNGRLEFVDLKVNTTSGPGDEIDLSSPGSVSVTVKWTATQNLTGSLELVQNGSVVASKSATATASSPVTLTTTVNFTKSGWLCARRMGADGHTVHTAAMFVIVNGAPIRTSASDAEFYVQWMDALLQNTAVGGAWASFYPTTRAAAQARYNQAKAVFQQIVVDAGGLTAPPSPTLGNSTEGFTTDSIYSGGAWINASMFQSASNATLTTMYAKVAAGTGHYKCAIYSGTASAPGSLLSGTTEVTAPGDGWQTFTLTTPVTITKGSYYWLAIWSDDPNARVYYSDNNGTLRWGQYNYGNWPASLSTSGVDNLDYCVYAMAASGPPPTLNSVTVSPVNPHIAVGAKQQFAATGGYSDGSSQDVTSQAAWSSSVQSVATISSGGLATGVSSGSSTIGASVSGLNGITLLTVDNVPLSISTTSLPGGTVNTAYSSGVAATGGKTPYSWLISPGSLPPGLSINASSGAITGTPTTTGTFSFTAQVSDSSSPVQTATKALSIAIASNSGGGGLIGNTNNGTTLDTIGDTIPWINAARFQAFSNMTVSTLWAKVGAITGHYKCAIYSDSGSQPANLLGSTVEVTNPAAGWQSFALGSPVALTSGQFYWLAIWSDSSSAKVYYQGTGTLRWGQYAYGATWPSPLSTSGGGTLNYCIYAVGVAGPPPTLTSIAVTPANPSIQAGTTQAFTATGTYSDSSTKNITAQVTWTSQNTGVATITSGGVATGVSAGTSSIGAALSGVSGSTTLTVQAPLTLVSIAVTPANPTVTAGGQQQFTATATYSDNSTANITSQASWSSTQTGVASINPSGLATAVSAGTSTIAATLSGKSGSTVLTVQPAPLSITTTSLPSGTINVTYSGSVAATGGTTPYAWSVSGGTFPTGLTLNGTSGAITGTPTAAGTFNFTVKVMDSGSPAQSTTKALSVTISATPASVTIWPNTASPGTVDSGPDSAVELGVKFKSDVAGQITGIRFYKASANTGTHVANLWSSTGTKLATATFSGETASGWQQVNFTTPVSITAGTTYVASYHCTSGHYSEDDSYFASSGVDNAPLHALPNGTSANGVYKYGSSSAFPNSTWLSANYWVDVVFVPSP